MERLTSAGEGVCHDSGVSSRTATARSKLLGYLELQEEVRAGTRKFLQPLTTVKNFQVFVF